MYTSILLSLTIAISFLSQLAQARPEYALKTTTVNCGNCHINPFGGGARTVFGKTYGSFGLGVSPFSKQDLFSADLRAVGYFPQSDKTKASGFSLMNVQGTLNAPITSEEQSGPKTNLVINFVSPELNQSSGESFLLIEPNAKMQLVIGKFVRPVGLLSDEHRTFVRMQTNSSIRDYESGIGLAHEVFETMHFDLTYTSEPVSSTLLQQPAWASLLNFRWTPYSAPLMLGFTTTHYDRPTEVDSAAQSIYGGYSFDRATEFSVPVSITLEASRAQGWTGKMNRLGNFINESTDSAFKASVVNKVSLGFYSQVLWSVKPHLSLLYKFDQLMFDEKYPADAFERHGLGVNWNLNSNTIFQVRYESAQNGRKDIDPAVKNSLDAFYFTIRAWL